MNKVIYILGVSGGIDSMWMLHLAIKHRKNIVVAHLNHSLREAADSDENFVREYCLVRKIPFISRKVDVGKYALDNKVSVETAGRILRYDFFADIAANYENAVIQTAHNQNDSVESFFLHLLRGSALNGLCGIKANSKVRLPDGREIRLSRPLLGYFTREIIEQKVKEEGIPYINDESNDDLKYMRNSIRHEIMPFIIKNSGIKKICAAMGRLRVDNDYLEKCVSDTPNPFEVKWFCELHEALQLRVIHKLSREFTSQTISEERILAVIWAIENNYGGKIIQLPDGVRVKIDKGKVEVYRET